MKLQIQLTLLLSTLGIAATAHACEACESPTLTPQAMTAVRDAETGLLRAPTPAEATALQSATQAAAAAKSAASRTAATAENKPALRAYASGARSARMPANLASFSVVTREPDGSLKSICLQGSEAASAALVTAPVAVPSSTKGDAQ